MKRSPAAAFWLALLPGIGHLYVGQVQKGLLLALLTAGAIAITDSSDGMLWPLIPFAWLFGMLDAYRSAQEMNRIADGGGVPPVDNLESFGKWWGWVLIALGIVLTLDNFLDFNFDWLWRLWPVPLIGFGAYTLLKKKDPGPQELAAPPGPDRPPVPEAAPVPETETVLETKEEHAPNE